jgi:hypothetical protein
MCGYLGSFRSVHDLGCVPVWYSCSSGSLECCSLRWLPGMHVHGSGGRLCNLANYTICLHGLDRSSPAMLGSFRVYSGSWNCPVTARTLQGMARVRSGQAPAWPLVSDRSLLRGSRVKCDFACTFTCALSPVLVALRSQSRLRLEGRTRTLSGPSPDLTSSASGFHDARRPGGRGS